MCGRTLSFTGKTTIVVQRMWLKFQTSFLQALTALPQPGVHLKLDGEVTVSPEEATAESLAIGPKTEPIVETVAKVGEAAAVGLEAMAIEKLAEACGVTLPLEVASASASAIATDTSGRKLETASAQASAQASVQPVAEAAAEAAASVSAPQMPKMIHQIFVTANPILRNSVAKSFRWHLLPLLVHATPPHLTSFCAAPVCSLTKS